MILADNIGQDWFDCYGSQENCTPQIDKLAAAGVRFEHCYVTPLCSTTRVEMYTGRYGLHTGWHTHHDAAIYGGGGLDPKREITWARALRDAGYKTAITGKWQINDLAVDVDALQQHGFDEHLVWTGHLEGEGNAEDRWKASIAPGGSRELESRYWDPIVFRNGEHLKMTGAFGPDVYVDYLVDFMTRHRDDPFVAYYAMPLVHVPTITTPLSPQKDAPEREQFAGMVRYLDHQIGRLTAALDRLSLRDDTIVVFMTDNGTSDRLKGKVRGNLAVGGLGTLREGGLDVPLIVNCPARIAQGRVSKALVDCSDIFPTLLDLAGVPIPEGLVIDGKSFASQLAVSESVPPPPRDWIFAQYASTRVVRDQRFKLYSTGELYDLTKDVNETTNLAASTSPDAVEARTRLQAVLAQLPADAKLPFSFRSSSAFKLEAERKKAAKSQ
ncbi:MAG: sulfatase-like hydrolase/transferase [Pirellulales bacterium]